MKNNGYKYKLIVYAGGEYVTDEYEYPVANLKEAAKKAEELRLEYDNGDYCDVRIDCLPYKDDIHHPSGDYRVWQRDIDGLTYWMWMKVSGYMHTRMYTYLKKM